ncbi:hypothetical protein NMY22_g4749 [Coprinellus aureogranulatus]|nr:hypothetical protein NMY22_g4749 [Coprinellus aureogranulatus]
MLSASSTSSGLSNWASTLCRSCERCSRVAGRTARSPKSKLGSSSRRSAATATRGFASSGSVREVNQYPFPSRRNASPHEIFHLPRGASEADVKARYFDLVRLYHPDKATDIPAEAAHARFRSITNAYDILRGKKASGTEEAPAGNPSVDLRYQTTAAWRAAHRKRQKDLYSTGAVDDKWKDRIILFGVLSTIVFVLVNTATTRREVLADVLNRPRVDGKYRFPEERVKQIQAVEDARLSAEPEGQS